jgi:hypothetical protein
VSVLLGNGNGTFQAAKTSNAGGAYGLALAVGDFNHDGVPDLAVVDGCPSNDNNCYAEGSGGLLSVLLGNGDGTFREAASYGVEWPSGGVAVGDFNGDGKLDLVLTTCNAGCGGYVGGVGILLGNGNGSFQTPQFYSSGATGPTSVVTGDFNQDGNQDVAVANSGYGGPGVVGLLLGNGDGSFQPTQTYSSGGTGAGRLAVADFNTDGKPDLAVTNNDSVGVLLGNGSNSDPWSVEWNSTVVQAPAYTGSTIHAFYNESQEQEEEWYFANKSVQSRSSKTRCTQKLPPIRPSRLRSRATLSSVSTSRVRVFAQPQTRLISPLRSAVR